MIDPMDERALRVLHAVSQIALPGSRGEGAARLCETLNLSPFHAQREFARHCGDTPGSIQRRVTLARAAAALRSTDESILTIAFDAGYQSHEAFTRAFRARFGMTPVRYRATYALPADAARHNRLVASAGPCLTLFRRSFEKQSPATAGPSLEEAQMSEEITTRKQDDQPVLQMRRRIRHEEISTVLGEMLPSVYEYAVQKGAEFAGAPYCAYREWTPGGVTVEAGLPVAAQVDGTEEIESSTVPGGTYAVAVHEGAYDSLNKTHALLDSWLEEHGHAADAPRYEVYLTDPGQYPDPSEWRTEVLCRIE